MTSDESKNKIQVKEEVKSIEKVNMHQELYEGENG